MDRSVVDLTQESPLNEVNSELSSNEIESSIQKRLDSLCASKQGERILKTLWNVRERNCSLPRADLGGFCQLPSFEDFMHARASKTEENVLNYEQCLKADPNFDNPGAVETMMKFYSIEDIGSLLGRPEYDRKDYWTSLRDQQNRAWAKETVAKGIEYAKSEDYTKALACYTQASEVDATYPDIYVARGAAYANQAKYKEAILEFDKALELDPDNRNAKRYQDATSKKLDELRLQTLIVEDKKPREERRSVDQKLKDLLEADDTLGLTRKKEKKEKKPKRDRSDKREKKEKKYKREKKHRKEKDRDYDKHDKKRQRVNSD